MTSLHYTLIALGIGLVVAMFLYNAFQERRSRKQAERIFGAHQGEFQRNDARSDDITFADVSLPEHHDDGRIEPRIRLTDDDEADAWEASPVQEPAASPQPSREGLEEPRPEPAHPPAPQRGEFKPESHLDGEIEYIARLRYSHPMVLAFATLMENLRRISKPIRLVGRREDGKWESVFAHAGRPYDTVELSLLLADRSGPVSEVQIDTFCRRLYDFATEHGGAVSCQDKDSALKRAKELDGFCAEVDMLIGLNVISPSCLDFSSRVIQELSDRAGLVQSSDGGYVLQDDEGRSLFTLATHDELLNPAGDDTQDTHGLSLLFDVPRVAHGLEAFDRMARLGFELAERLGGQLVDDGGRPVSRDSLTKDRRRLEMLYAHMEQRGIPAGGERAMRLFA